MAKKGQAALEYLSTYGWLLIIIVIVAAALYALGIFNPATYQGKSCTGFSTGVTYIDHKLAADGTFSFVASNGIGKTITAVPKVNMTGSDGTAAEDITTGVSLPWTPGAKRTMTLTGPDLGDTGNGYTMTVSVYYSTGDVANHVQTGTCTGTIE